MTTLKPYPSYCKTDIPWLGQIPAHLEAQAKTETIEKEIMDMLKEATE